MRQIWNIGAILTLLVGLALPARAALTYTQTAAASSDTVFLGMVSVSLVKTSQAVMAENPLVTNHAARVALARAILYNTQAYAIIFSINVALAPNIQALTNLDNAAPADIDNQVSAVFNSYL